MKKNKFLFTAASILAFCTFSTTNVFATESGDYNEPSVDVVETLAETISYSLSSQGSFDEGVVDSISTEINDLSDKDFDRLMHDVVQENKYQPEALKSILEEVDVEFQAPKSPKNSISLLAIDANEITFKAYSTKRAGDSYYRLNSSWTSSILEARPATYDVVSIEWEPKKATYYGNSHSTSTKNPVTAKDGSKRSSGIYLFNSQDKSNAALDGYVVVYVTPTSSKGSLLNFGSKYAHTYGVTSSTVTGEASIGFSASDKFSGGLGFSVASQTNVAKWGKYVDNVLIW